MRVALSPEFQLVCACCRWPREESDDALVRELAENADWKRVVAIAERQRVQGLVAHALGSAKVSVPEPYGARISGIARRMIVDNLGMTAECARLLVALRASGIDALFVKGLPLAVQIYQSLSIKMSLDIDILVALEKIETACGLLAELGYSRTVPDASISADQLTVWVQYFKETSWVHDESGIIVDLHARLISNPTLVRHIGLGSPRADVLLTSNIAVPTLERDTLFVYLCVHGAEAGWSRLKWLADLGAMIGACDKDEIYRLYEFAEQEGAGRCAAQGLLLAAELLGTQIGDRLALRLRRPLINRLLVRMARSSITGVYEIDAHRHDTIGGLPILASHFLLRRGVRHKLAELGSKISNPRDRALRRLPPWLTFLYPGLGILRWTGKRLGLVRANG